MAGSGSRVSNTNDMGINDIVKISTDVTNLDTNNTKNNKSKVLELDLSKTGDWFTIRPHTTGGPVCADFKFV